MNARCNARTSYIRCRTACLPIPSQEAACFALTRFISSAAEIETKFARFRFRSRELCYYCLQRQCRPHCLQRRENLVSYISIVLLYCFLGCQTVIDARSSKLGSTTAFCRLSNVNSVDALDSSTQSRGDDWHEKRETTSTGRLPHES